MVVAGTPQRIADPAFQFSESEQPIRFDDAPFRMALLRLDRIEPRTATWQEARHQSAALPAAQDGLVVRAQPITHLAADMPPGIAPASTSVAIPSAVAWSAHQPRNCSVRVLTGRPSTQRSQVSCRSGSHSP